MRLPTSFSPIEVNEIDNFAFDFTAEVGSAAILSTSWSCKIGPFQTATDENSPGKDNTNYSGTVGSTAVLARRITADEDRFFFSCNGWRIPDFGNRCHLYSRGNCLPQRRSDIKRQFNCSMRTVRW